MNALENMTHPELVRALKKPSAHIAKELTELDCDVLHMAVGISTEAAELLRAANNALRGEVDRENIKEELGDLEFYVEGLRQSLGLRRTFVGQIPQLADEEDSGPDRSWLAFLHSCVFVSIQAGEILDMAKKSCIYRNPLPHAEAIVLMINMDGGLDRVRNIVAMTLGEVLDANIAKLSVRYSKLTYTDAAGGARADEQGV